MKSDRELFDSNICIGRGMKYATKGIDVAGLPKLIGRCGVAKALVWHVSQFDGHPVRANEIICEEIAGNDNLLGSWTVLPPITGEMDFKNLFKRMKKSRIAALRAFPDRSKYQMDRTTWGAFMDEVSERRIPLILMPGLGIDWTSLSRFLAEYPKIRCVIQDFAIWGVSRLWWPLLDKYPNTVIHSATPSLEAGGLEAAVAKFGATRIVFGSSFPEKYLEGAVLQLANARIKDSEKALIASGNLEAILKEADYE